MTTKIGSGATPTGGEAAYLSARSKFALVRSQNVYDRSFDSQGLAFISDDQAQRLRGVRLQPGDVLLNITGDGVTFGRACLVPDDAMPACVNQHVSIIRADRGQVVAGYVLAFLTHPDVKPYIESFNAGGSRRAITKGHIEQFKLPLPPLPEQQAIAAILGALDDKIDLNRRLNETLEQTARALFKSWFVDFDPVRAKAEGRQPFGIDAATAAVFPDGFEDSELGEVPRGWRVGPATALQADGKYACVAGPFGSNLTSKDYMPSGVPVIRGSNLSGAGIWLRDTEFVFVSEDKAQTLAGNVALPGDVVFTQRGTLGQVALVPRDSRFDRFVLSQSQMKLTVDSTIGSPFYVAMYFQQPQVIDYIVANGQQAGVPHINLGFLRTFKLRLPPTSVQRAFDKVVGPLLFATRDRDTESRSLAEIRDYLLPKLLSGEVRIREAEKIVGEAT